MGVMALKHGNAKRFFRTKVVMKDPFGTSAVFRSSLSPIPVIHVAGKVARPSPGDVREYHVGVFVHALECSRPVGLVQAKFYFGH